MQKRHQRLVELIEHLLKEGWTQTTLSVEIGVDFSTVYRWLKGKAIPETDSKNFLRLAKLSGGDSETLQQYLEGYISLSTYLQNFDLDKNSLNTVTTSNKYPVEQIKKEVMTRIYTLDPADIADIINTSVTFLAKSSKAAIKVEANY
ncbi:MAG: helix-turn-helix transcriptional regulator [Dolichospermum sp. OL03]|nr:helix-turn-helix transcriptional regulator [Dolichospermum sp. OL03]MCS6282326.1 helix-turn-helix transcriptional regulator [Dolichospermum sp.]